MRVKLSGFQLMLQATIVDCKLFDPFPFLQNGLTSPEVDIRRGEIVQVLIFGMHNYAEAQTGGQNYVVQRKRSKAEILRRAVVR